MDFYKWGEDYQKLMIKKINSFSLHGNSSAEKPTLILGAASEYTSEDTSEYTSGYTTDSASARLSESTPEYVSCLKSYLKKYTFDFEKIAGARRILIIEEDSRVQNVLQRLIQEENTQTVCVFGETVDDVHRYSDQSFDLIIACYYQSEDEVDYDFWDEARKLNPGLEVIVLSHVNDREYYEMIEKLENVENTRATEVQMISPVTTKLKNLFGQVFGGRHG